MADFYDPWERNERAEDSERQYWAERDREDRQAPHPDLMPPGPPIAPKPLARGIPLYARAGHIRAFTLVDADDYDWLTQWPWKLHSEGYVCRTPEGGPALYLHRVILGLTKAGRSVQVDHVDRDRLNNTRRNLRIVTPAENKQNVRPHSQSGYLGVSFHRKTGSWQATYRGAVNRGQRTRQSLGYYKTAFEAAVAVERYRRAHLPFYEPNPEFDDVLGNGRAA